MASQSPLPGILGVAFPVGTVALIVAVLIGTGGSFTGKPSSAAASAPAGTGSMASGSSMPAAPTTPATPATPATPTPTTADSTSNPASGSAAPSSVVKPPTGNEGSKVNASAAAPAPTTAAANPVNGATVFTAHCAACHGAAGAGVPGAFPPLAGNAAILGDQKYVADVLLYGLQGNIAVKGQSYNGVMPAWAAQLSDNDIAAVTSYIRSQWGNQAPAISAATVAAERAAPKTSAQVLAERPQ
ncbi:c-type cytochrome [Deinococcus sp.]|uniref:c-type cytochrome n=1 Tax=Deinococcus sp. TaxID=47478 RepID=UPI003CC60AE0